MTVSPISMSPGDSVITWPRGNSKRLQSQRPSPVVRGGLFERQRPADAVETIDFGMRVAQRRGRASRNAGGAGLPSPSPPDRNSG